MFTYIPDNGRGRGSTSCCDTEATYVDETLCCKSCYEEVVQIQGDPVPFKYQTHL